MSISLLTTKFFFPPARQNLVSRPRLIEKVTQGLQSLLLLVSAPAGYGKTTVMSEWRTGIGCDYPVAWLSLDRDDNDVTYFLTSIISALATVKHGFGETTLSLLQSSPPLPTRLILTDLINALGNFDKTFSLILDDYHVITNPPIHEVVTYFLDHLPSQMHLVILTREDPPLPLSRLRVRNQLVEIRAADLRFTAEEAAVFLNQVMGLVLSIDQVGTLEQHTEGWAAGLQLAALSMKGREDVQNFVSTFTGSHHYIVDYLADEVLNRQSETVRDFLVRTSILDRLTAPLCNVLTDRIDGQAMLEYLEHANLFLIPMDDEQCWYRYHPLFADVLRKRLQQTYPDGLPELHRRAATWCEHNQFIELAVEHTFAIKDYDQVIRLLRQYFLEQMLPNRSSSIWRWFESFPDDILRKNPRLCVSYAWLFWGRGNRDAAESYLNYAQRELAQQSSSGIIPKDNPEFTTLTAEMLAFQGLINATKGELERTIELANQALAIVPEASHTLRSMAYLDLYLAYRDRGEIDKAIEACNQAISPAKEGGQSAIIIDAFNNLALLYIMQGKLNRAEKVYQEGLQYFENEMQSDYSGCRIFFIHLAGLNYEWNKLEEAERLAIRALELSEPAYYWLMLFGRVFLARLQRAKGNWPAALKLMNEAEALLQQLHGTFFESELKAHLARLQAELGKSDEAGQWVQSVTLDIRDRLSIHQYVLAFQLAHTLSALDREDELLTLMSQVEPISAAQGYLYWRVEALVLQAAAWQKKANADRALTCLEKALFLAEKEGYARVFLDEGEPMQLLMADFRSQIDKRMRPEQGEDLEHLKAYTTKLLLSFPQVGVTTPKSALHPRQPTIIESLSEREVEILRLVAEGKSNQQIADSLIIATGTVKKHLNNIFGKLGVQSRTQCVARARELNLL